MEELDNDKFFSAKALYDIKLVERALGQSDQKAFAELMKRYWEPVFFMLNRMVNNKDDAEDLTIEAFGKAFKNLQQYSPQFAFSTWLFKIASNNAIDYLRKKKMENLTSLDKPVGKDSNEDLSQQIKGSGLTPEENYIKKQGVDRVHEIIDKLKPRYKEIVEMFYLEELSVEEISQRLDLPVATIKTRLFRARELLLQVVKRNKDF
ncbi:MAG TPA: sigma-70 family RNA polymerase sigma factor [Bacteroidia bacterium]|jgi:RNA polymerase sigma factor (sigma-70 family)|nr:sigma-70 family RNA polymerase sigma factor [Bacteroidia bacterium]